MNENSKSTGLIKQLQDKLTCLVSELKNQDYPGDEIYKLAFALNRTFEPPYNVEVVVFIIKPLLGVKPRSVQAREECKRLNLNTPEWAMWAFEAPQNTLIKHTRVAFTENGYKIGPAVCGDFECDNCNTFMCELPSHIANLARGAKLYSTDILMPALGERLKVLEKTHSGYVYLPCHHLLLTLRKFRDSKWWLPEDMERSVMRMICAFSDVTTSESWKFKPDVISAISTFLPPYRIVPIDLRLKEKRALTPDPTGSKWRKAFIDEIRREEDIINCCINDIAPSEVTVVAKELFSLQYHHSFFNPSIKRYPGKYQYP